MGQPAEAAGLGAGVGRRLARLLDPGDHVRPLHRLRLVQLRQAPARLGQRHRGVQDLPGRRPRPEGEPAVNLAPQDIFPQIADWIASLDDIFPGKQVKPWFAQWEVGHILSLIVLGGSSILLNLRLIGVGLTDEPPSELHRNMRGWMIAGVIGIVATGLLIGSANAERLYTSEAFTAKMIGLLAGIILTFAVK